MTPPRIARQHGRRTPKPLVRVYHRAFGTIPAVIRGHFERTHSRSIQRADNWAQGPIRASSKDAARNQRRDFRRKGWRPAVLGTGGIQEDRMPGASNPIFCSGISASNLWEQSPATPLCP